jgi:phosphomannomutase
VSRLPDDAAIGRLFIMPTTGTKLYRFDHDRWQRTYADDFDAETRAAIVAALESAMRSLGHDRERTWGEQIEDRGSQITFSALGQQAPIEAKEAWDPDRSKRQAMQKALETALPDLSVKVGGSTSIDITRDGVDKGYAIERLSAVSGVAIADMIFVGDALYPGGNDEPVKRTGIHSIPVRDPDETLEVISRILADIAAVNS